MSAYIYPRLKDLGTKSRDNSRRLGQQTQDSELIKTISRHLGGSMCLLIRLTDHERDEEEDAKDLKQNIERHVLLLLVYLLALILCACCT